MNNPNESILTTELGTPIGEVALADNSCVPETLPSEQVAEENREAALRSIATEVTGDPDAAKAIAELYPHYGDAEMRKRAMALYLAERKSIEDVAKKVGAPQRTVSMWAYNDGWDRLAGREVAALETQVRVEMARLRAAKRAKIAKEQLEQAERLRNAAIKKLNEGETSIKPAAEAWAMAAKVEHAVVGIAETGAVASLDGSEEEKKKKDGGKPSLVMVFQGGLPPVRRAGQ